MSANRYVRYVDVSPGLIRDSEFFSSREILKKKTCAQHQVINLLL
ncbi:MAG: hypothetical protein WCC86_08330 [Methanoregula sp.]